MIRTTSLAALACATILLAACTSTSSSSTDTAAATVPSITASTSVSVAATDAATYADGLCTSIDQWQQSLADGNKKLQGSITAGTTTPQDAKDALEAFMTSAVQDTQTMLDQIHALGAPSGAEDATAAIETELTNVETLFQSVLSTVQGLDTTNPAAMQTAVASLAPQLQQGGQDITDAIGSIQNTELSTAIDNAPACQSL